MNDPLPPRLVTNQPCLAHGIELEGGKKEWKRRHKMDDGQTPISDHVASGTVIKWGQRHDSSETTTTCQGPIFVCTRHSWVFSPSRLSKTVTSRTPPFSGNSMSLLSFHPRSYYCNWTSSGMDSLTGISLLKPDVSPLVRVTRKVMHARCTSVRFRHTHKRHIFGD